MLRHNGLRQVDETRIVHAIAVWRRHARQPEESWQKMRENRGTPPLV